MGGKVHVGLLLLVALVLAHTHAKAGIDKVYTKPQSAQNWGEMLADVVGYRGYQKSYALVVGISAYSGGHRNLPTQNDPIRMRNFLLNEAGFDYVHVLTDEKVTYRRLRTLMEDEFPKRVDRNDRFLFYWSGHGTQRPLPGGGQSGYLPLAASIPKKFGTMVHMGDIERWDRNIAAEQALYLVDACFSGLAGAVTKWEHRAMTIEQLAQPSRHLIVAGTGGEQTIAGDQWGGSIFTDSVLEGLRGNADAASAFDRDGLVSLNELIDYVKKRVSFEKRRAGWTKAITPQLRDLRTNIGEFFFLTGTEKIVRVEQRGERTTGEFKHGMPVTVMSPPRSVESRPQGRLTVRSNVFNDSVYINGEYKGSTRLDLKLPPGQYRVGVSKQDHEDWERQITLEEGAEEVLWAKLVRSTKPSIRPHIDVERSTAEKPKQKKEWRDPVTGMEFVWVPKGCFQMGGNGVILEQNPVHEVCMDGFWMGKYEVTFAEYDTFAAATGREKPDDRGWGRGNRPVIKVSWNDAKAYAKWLSKETGKHYRLPSEAEWEYAARANTTTTYWWGNEIKQEGKIWANCYGCGSQWDRKKTSPVGSFETNPFGLYDTAGNVWEWVEDCWHGSYEGAPEDGSAWISGGNCVTGVLRGGSWKAGSDGVRSVTRNMFGRVYRNIDFGFRLARDL